MDCKTAQHWMQLELDGELAPPKQVELRAHRSACAPCRAHHDQLTVIQSAFGHLASITNEPCGQVASIDLPRPRTIPLWPAWAAAAAVALCVTTWLLMSRQPAPDRPAPEIIVEIKTDQPSETQVAMPDRTHQPIECYVPSSQPRAIVRFANGDDLIVVPHKTSNPNITIIWAYETTKTASARPDPDTELPPSS